MAHRRRVPMTSWPLRRRRKPRLRRLSWGGSLAARHGLWHHCARQAASPNAGIGDDSLSRQLGAVALPGEISDTLRVAIARHRPTVCVIEGIFFVQNLKTALTWVRRGARRWR